MASRLSSFFKGFMPERKGKFEQYNQDEAIWAFLMAQHPRAGKSSAANMVRRPDLQLFRSLTLCAFPSFLGVAVAKSPSLLKVLTSESKLSRTILLLLLGL
jgi:hypothetical protein